MIARDKSVEIRALKIASSIMYAAGLCRYESYSKCRRVYVDEIVAWLIAKAKREMKKEGSCGKVD